MKESQAVIRKRLGIAGIAACLCFCTSGVLAKTTWQTLQPGIEYTKIDTKPGQLWGSLHAFRINLKKYNLSMAMAKDLGSASLSVREMAKQKHSLIAINGGFFSPALEPLGLRVLGGKVLNPIAPTSWWGVFYLRYSWPHVSSRAAYRQRSSNNFAIQGGPRLLVNGRIPTLKPGLAERTALGITKRYQLIMVVTENSPLTTTQLAQIMRRPEKEDGLACVNALNLDGGSSSQLYAKINDFSVDVSGFSAVTDAVLVVPKKAS